VDGRQEVDGGKGQDGEKELVTTVYSSDESIEKYHKMCVEFFNKATEAQPTAFHPFLSNLRRNEFLEARGVWCCA
jgi:hypothetical protein